MGRLDHRLRRMTGRDPDENHRAATPLELFFDLTFVIAFGAAANEFAHYVAEGHVAAGLTGFAFAVFAVTWAWINYSWFASAFDTDDWLFRVATFVQMVGVIILTLGLPPMFASIDHGETLDNGIMVAGYIVMRVAMLALWIRVIVTDPAHRPAATTYAVTIAIAQLGWIWVLVAELPIGIVFLATIPLYLIELCGPILAERGKGGTPWHPGHIAERYGLLTIITLGEVVLGTVTATSTLVAEIGWSLDAVVIVFSGTALAFGVWWIYFAVPSGFALRYARGRSFAWGYGHLVVFGAIAAMGAGLHVAALHAAGHSVLSDVGVIATIAVPLLVLWVAIFVLFSLIVKAVDTFHVPLFILSVLAIAAAVVAVGLGASVTVGIAILVLSPLIVIVGYETVGHRHELMLLERLQANAAPGRDLQE
jgi:low temperature requirement protein LtrA